MLIREQSEAFRALLDAMCVEGEVIEVDAANCSITVDGVQMRVTVAPEEMYSEPAEPLISRPGEGEDDPLAE